MQKLKEEIKKNVEGLLKGFYYDSAESQLTRAKTICFLLDAYHKTERPYYKKRPYKKEGGKYENANNTEL